MDSCRPPKVQHAPASDTSCTSNGWAATAKRSVVPRYQRPSIFQLLAQNLLLTAGTMRRLVAYSSSPGLPLVSSGPKQREASGLFLHTPCLRRDWRHITPWAKTPAKPGILCCQSTLCVDTVEVPEKGSPWVVCGTGCYDAEQAGTGT